MSIWFGLSPFDIAFMAIFAAGGAGRTADTTTITCDSTAYTADRA
jgi:hypothetical protein